MRSLAVDVLILGAGLAGLRTALSCLTSAPGCNVLVASLHDGPSGSSFANQNDALGIHACACDQEGQAYVQETLTRNTGAYLDENLLAIQAQEGWDRLMDLVDMGLPFLRDASGQLLRHSSCFAPESRRAFVFKGLSQAYHTFRTRLDTAGCRFLPGHLPAALLPGGALLLPYVPKSDVTAGKQPGPAVAVRAKATIVALGGPGRLFRHSMAGPGVVGYSHGLLAQAGIRMANTGYLQWMWATVPGNIFWQPAALAQGGYRVRTTVGDIPFEAMLNGWDDTCRFASVPGSASRQNISGLSGQAGRPITADPVGPTFPTGPADMPSLAQLAASRSGHCPFGHGLPDAAMDLTLARQMDGSGVVGLLTPEGAPLHVAPMAHATNGGAVINAWGETNVPGLLACGECATGMHGSNRLGGGMILASQVFGHRAGLRAAQLAAERPEPDDVYAAARNILTGLHSDVAERRKGLRELGLGLSRFAPLGGRPGNTTFKGHLKKQHPRDWLLALCHETALEILSGLPYPG